MSARLSIGPAACTNQRTDWLICGRSGERRSDGLLFPRQPMNAPTTSTQRSDLHTRMTERVVAEPPSPYPKRRHSQLRRYYKNSRASGTAGVQFLPRAS